MKHSDSRVSRFIIDNDENVARSSVRALGFWKWRSPRSRKPQVIHHSPGSVSIWKLESSSWCPVLNQAKTCGCCGRVRKLNDLGLTHSWAMQITGSDISDDDCQERSKANYHPLLRAADSIWQGGKALSDINPGERIRAGKLEVRTTLSAKSCCVFVLSPTVGASFHTRFSTWAYSAALARRPQEGSGCRLALE